MALKAKITKAAFKKLPEVLQAEYTEDGDDYVLDVEGQEDTGALKRARDREKADRIEAQKKLKELEDKQAAQDDDDLRKSGDIEKLTKKWEDDLEAERSKGTKATEALQKQIAKDRRENAANTMAAAISNNPKIMARFIQDRLAVEFDDDNNAKTIILDKDGKPSDLSIEALQKEMVANPDFKDMILAHKGSGGAGSDKDKSKGGSATKYTPIDDKETPDLSKLSPKEMAARITAKKEAEAEAAEE